MYKCCMAAVPLVRAVRCVVYTFDGTEKNMDCGHLDFGAEIQPVEPDW